MLTAKVIGAGSIGSHLTHALRSLNVDVTMVDVDKNALERTETLIYPERYGSFDKSIKLAHPSEVGDKIFDLCVIGTPPDTHIVLATDELAVGHRALMIEKPLASPGARALRNFSELVDMSPTRVLVAYNQRLKTNTAEFLSLAQSSGLGPLVSITGRMREDWAGILRAHPWISDATNSYLGHTSRGGGALYEHSHATDFALFIALSLGQGRPTRVKANLDVIQHATGSYDRQAELLIEMSSGMTIDVVQDLFTWPADKSLDAVFANGSVRWEMNSDYDAVTLTTAGRSPKVVRTPKTRPDDFFPEMKHVVSLLDPDNPHTSPLDISEALHTSWTLEAAVESARTGRWVPLRRH